MSELSRLFGPRYRASPGSVYPAIEALQLEELIDGQAIEGRTVYTVTSPGRQALQDRAELLAALELRLDVRLDSEDTFDAALTRFKARLAPLNGRVDPLDAEPILERAALELEQLEESRNRKQRRRNER
ncbi:MAG: PadR family transcriptional regulator [Actinobacteria bacterium]|nr:PadR family transcriptional regulator [Actinomycetota bacterium]